MLRYRGKKLALNIVKELDSFPKVQEEIYEPSTYSNVIRKIIIKIINLHIFLSSLLKNVVHLCLIFLSI